MMGMSRARHCLSLVLGCALVLAAAGGALAASGDPPVGKDASRPPADAPKDASRPPVEAAKPSLDDLFAKLAAAKDDAAAAATEGEIERRFRESGSPTIDVLMAQSGRAIEAGNFALARDLLDAVVRLEPDYAEGWNRRAAVAFQADEYGLAVADIERALALEPRHFGALAGLGTLLRHLDRKEAALQAYEAVLALNPRDADAKKAQEELKRETHGLDL